MREEGKGDRQSAASPVFETVIGAERKIG